MADKAWACQKKKSSSFPYRMLKNIWIESAFPYALLPCHEEAIRNTIGVVGETSAKLPHYKSFTLTYLMENKMSLIHHAMERWGCSYTNEDDKGLSERTRWHLMLKPNSKLRWHKGLDLMN